MALPPSGRPSWGGGSGARQASTAAAAKLRGTRDFEKARSTSSLSMRAGESTGWGAPSEREACPAPTPAASPTVTPTKMDERAAAEAADATVAAAPTAAPAACAPAPAAAACAPVSARAALEALAAQLGAAARGSGMAQAVAGTWEEAFLAGVAVGLQLPSAGRRQTGIQRAMVLVLLVCGLAVVCGASLLVAGVAGQHPRAVFYS